MDDVVPKVLESAGFDLATVFNDQLAREHASLSWRVLAHHAFDQATVGERKGRDPIQYFREEGDITYTDLLVFREEGDITYTDLLVRHAIELPDRFMYAKHANVSVQYKSWLNPGDYTETFMLNEATFHHHDPNDLGREAVTITHANPHRAVSIDNIRGRLRDRYDADRTHW